MALDVDLLKPIGFILLGIAILVFVKQAILILGGWALMIYGVGQVLFQQTLDKNGRK